MSKSRFTTRQLATAGIIAGIYAGLTLILPIPQYHGVQLRVAEAMTPVLSGAVPKDFFPHCAGGTQIFSRCFCMNDSEATLLPLRRILQG